MGRYSNNLSVKGTDYVKIMYFCSLFDFNNIKNK